MRCLFRPRFAGTPCGQDRTWHLGLASDLSLERGRGFARTVGWSMGADLQETDAGGSGSDLQGRLEKDEGRRRLEGAGHQQRLLAPGGKAEAAVPVDGRRQEVNSTSEGHHAEEGISMIENGAYGERMARYLHLIEPPLHATLGSGASALALTRLHAPKGFSDLTEPIPSQKAFSIHLHLRATPGRASVARRQTGSHRETAFRRRDDPRSRTATHCVLSQSYRCRPVLYPPCGAR
jgi:hypothetical protein